MKITFVAEAYESLGIEYLSSTLKSKGHIVSLVYDPKLFNDAFFNIPLIHKKFFPPHQFIKKILATEPDIVAFSVMSESYLWNLKIATKIKCVKNIPIIFGGIHPTSCPEDVIRENSIDLVCVGEGENAFLQLAERFDREGNTEAAGINNIIYKERIYGEIIRNPTGYVTKNLDDIPFPDKQLFINAAPHMAKRYYIMTSRGCPFNCAFCYNSTLKNKKEYLRKRSIENVLEELKLALDNGYSYVMFGDDTFTQDKTYLTSFLKRYQKEINKPFVCAVHPRTIDSDTIKLLKTSGCTDIEIGVQTVNPEVRRNVLKRPESNEEIFRAMELVKRHKIRLIVDHIGGISGEIQKDYKDAVLAYKKYKPNYIAFFWLAYYPETLIAKTAFKTGILSEEIKKLIYRGRGIDGKGTYDIVIDEYLGFEFIFALVPILPMFVLRFLVNHNFHRFIKKRMIGIMVFFPRFIRCVIDLNFRPFIRHINRYLDVHHYIYRK